MKDQNIPERDKLQSVIDGWLKIATDGLCLEARERVRAEIETHGRDTCEALVAEGYTPVAALQAMLLSLGDPRAACRSLRRVYLTETQENYIQRLIRPGRWRVLESWICGLAFAGPAIYCALFMDQVLPIVTITIAIALIVMMNRILQRVLCNQPTRRQLDLLILFKVLGFLFYTGVFASPWLKFRSEIPIVCVYLVIVLDTLGPLARITAIRIKLGKLEPPNLHA